MDAAGIMRRIRNEGGMDGEVVRVISHQGDPSLSPVRLGVVCKKNPNKLLYSIME